MFNGDADLCHKFVAFPQKYEAQKHKNLSEFAT